MKKLNVEKLTALLDERLRTGCESCRLAGAEIVVLQHDECVYHRFRGYKNARTGELLKGGELYRLASMTKPITGLAVLLAVQDGLISVDDEVSKYLPAFADMDVAVLNDENRPVVDHKNPTPLRIWHLLCHVSGIFSATPLGEVEWEDIPKSAFRDLAHMVDYYASRPLNYDANSYYSYSGYAAFDVAARIIEVTSGMSYTEYLTKKLFEPLGIRDMTFAPTEEQWSRMAELHNRTDNAGLALVDMGPFVFESFPVTYTCGGAGLAGTACDYTRIMRLMLGEGTVDGKEIIRRDIFRLMTIPRVPESIANREPSESWGLGVRVVDHATWLPVGTFGWSGAYGTHFFIEPESGVAALIMRASRFYDSNGGGTIGAKLEKDVMSCLE